MATLNQIQGADGRYKFANVAASATDSVLVTAVPGRTIIVVAFRLMAGTSATNVTFNTKAAGSGVACSELFACGANGGVAEPYCPMGHFATNQGEALTVTTGSGATTGIGIVYVLI